MREKFSFINIFKCHIILVILVSCFPQAQTMQMMYEIIAGELKSMHLESSHPQDYLNFYCLGNREELPKEASPSLNQSSKNGDTVSYTFFPLLIIKRSFSLKQAGVNRQTQYKQDG